jgi:hypothetical protein
MMPLTEPSGLHARIGGWDRVDDSALKNAGVRLGGWVGLGTPL